MTALPSNTTKVNLDSAADDPSQARAELATGLDATNTVISYLTNLFGADGVKATAISTLGVPTLTTANVWTKTQSFTKGADLASATSLALGTDGNYFDVTGTTSIGTITGVAGSEITLQTDGAVTFTDSATLDLGGVSYTSVAGDRLSFFMLTASLAQLTSAVVEGTGILKGATQAQQETGTSNTVMVTPGRQHSHPSAVKGWAEFTAASVVVETYQNDGANTEGSVTAIMVSAMGDHA